jgi:hypothetical protein
MTGVELSKIYNRATLNGSAPLEDVRRLVDAIIELGVQLDTARNTADVWRQRAQLSRIDAAEATVRA